MTSNLDRFRKDLKKLITKGESLQLALQFDCMTEVQKQSALKKHKEFLESLPKFNDEYQTWYSESLALLRQLLPDRVADFVRHYEKPKNRKQIDADSYRIEDALQGLRTSRIGEVLADRTSALPHLAQQIAIVKATEARFESSLFDIRQIVQADLFDSELSAAQALAKFRFHRAAGALAGVVLEKHLAQVCIDHNVKPAKKNPGISDFNEALKAADVIGVADWRFIQHLADIRNTCDHGREEPKPEQVTDLISGVEKTIKTIF
ncbi:hypothetical protein [Cupriavidus sp. CP313]